MSSQEINVSIHLVLGHRLLGEESQYQVGKYTSMKQ